MIIQFQFYIPRKIILINLIPGLNIKTTKFISVIQYYLNTYLV